MSSAPVSERGTPLRLVPHAVDAWVIHLDQPADVRDLFERTLASDEVERANRFVFDRDHRRYVVCRGALRHILAQYVGLSPAALRFAYGERGKPSMATPSDLGLEFNVSHAAGVAVAAVATGTAIGVDLESASRTIDFDPLARRFFSPREADELLSLPAAERRRAFFACWTRKEAYIKAIGDGLACPLDSFAVTLRPGDPPAFRWIATDDAASWTLRTFEPAVGYVAALAARTPIASVTCRDFQGLLS